MRYAKWGFIVAGTFLGLYALKEVVSILRKEDKPKSATETAKEATSYVADQAARVSSVF